MKIKTTGYLNKPMSKKQLIEHVTKSVTKLSIDCENHAKEIISDHSVDTGDFLNSIWSEVKIDKNKISFKLHDGVNYGYFWEKGTKLHWTPFYRNGDVSQPILADWGHRVLGLTKEEMLKMGGIKTKLPELMPFLKSLLFIQGMSADEFKKYEKEFRDRVKRL